MLILCHETWNFKILPQRYLPYYFSFQVSCGTKSMFKPWFRWTKLVLYRLMIFDKEKRKNGYIGRILIWIRPMWNVFTKYLIINSVLFMHLIMRLSVFRVLAAVKISRQDSKGMFTRNACLCVVAFNAKNGLHGCFSAIASPLTQCYTLKKILLTFMGS